MALIEQSAVIEVLKNSAKDIKRCVKEDDNYFVDWYADGLAKRVEQLPAVDAVPVRHSWWRSYTEDGEELTNYDGTPMFMTCHTCYKTVFRSGSTEWNYCPTCGAKMDGKDGADG